MVPLFPSPFFSRVLCPVICVVVADFPPSLYFPTSPPLFSSRLYPSWLCLLAPSCPTDPPTALPICLSTTLRAFSPSSPLFLVGAASLLPRDGGTRRSKEAAATESEAQSHTETAAAAAAGTSGKIKDTASSSSSSFFPTLFQAAAGQGNLLLHGKEGLCTLAGAR